MDPYPFERGVAVIQGNREGMLRSESWKLLSSAGEYTAIGRDVIDHSPVFNVDDRQLMLDALNPEKVIVHVDVSHAPP